MIQGFISEHAQNARLALDLARKEAHHLAYSHRTLFAQSIVDTITRYAVSIGLISTEPHSAY